MIVFRRRFGAIFTNLGGHFGPPGASKRASSEPFRCQKGATLSAPFASFYQTWLGTPPGPAWDPPRTLPGPSGDPPGTPLVPFWAPPGSDFGTNLSLQNGPKTPRRTHNAQPPTFVTYGLAFRAVLVLIPICTQRLPPMREYFSQLQRLSLSPLTGLPHT